MGVTGVSVEVLLELEVVEREEVEGSLSKSSYLPTTTVLVPSTNLTEVPFATDACILGEK